MATSEMSPQDAAALYERKVRELHPSAAVVERVQEYRRGVEEKAESR
jgi:hypothetical protein